jgi:hypothetical protein
MMNSRRPTLHVPEGEGPTYTHLWQDQALSSPERFADWLEVLRESHYKNKDDETIPVHWYARLSVQSDGAPVDVLFYTEELPLIGKASNEVDEPCSVSHDGRANWRRPRCVRLFVRVPVDGPGTTRGSGQTRPFRQVELNDWLRDPSPGYHFNVADSPHGWDDLELDSDNTVFGAWAIGYIRGAYRVVGENSHDSFRPAYRAQMMDLLGEKTSQ